MSTPQETHRKKIRDTCAIFGGIIALIAFFAACVRTIMFDNNGESSTLKTITTIIMGLGVISSFALSSVVLHYIPEESENDCSHDKRRTVASFNVAFSTLLLLIVAVYSIAANMQGKGPVIFRKEPLAMLAIMCLISAGLFYTLPVADNKALSPSTAFPYPSKPSGYDYYGETLVQTNYDGSVQTINTHGNVTTITKNPDGSLTYVYTDSHGVSRGKTITILPSKKGTVGLNMSKGSQKTVTQKKISSSSVKSNKTKAKTTPSGDSSNLVYSPSTRSTVNGKPTTTTIITDTTFNVIYTQVATSNPNGTTTLNTTDSSGGYSSVTTRP